MFFLYYEKLFVVKVVHFAPPYPMHAPNNPGFASNDPGFGKGAFRRERFFSFFDPGDILCRQDL